MSLSTEQLIMVLNALPDPVFLLTDDGFYAGLFGHSDPHYYHDGHDLVGCRLHDVLPHDVADWIMQKAHLSLHENRLIKVEYPLSAQQVKGLENKAGPDGMLWFEGHIQPFPSLIDGKEAVIWVARNITERKQLQDELLHATLTDPLTGLFNRRKLVDALGEHFAEFQRYGHPLSLIMFDIDRFKQLNDTLGHLQGDAVLQALAQLCKPLLRSNDLLVRFGGEEFVILLPSTHRQEALLTAERIRHHIEDTLASELGLP